MTQVSVLIPTFERPAALAITLTSLAAQSFSDFDVVISDQGEDTDAASSGEVRAVVRVLEWGGHHVRLLKHLPRRGMAEQRQFLLDHAEAPLALFLDDDLLLERSVLDHMVATIREHECGFVGMAPIGLSYRDDVRPHQQAIELWPGRVEPEALLPGGPRWARHRLHSAANPLHVQEALGLGRDDRLPYRVAWVGGCVLYDVQKLRDCGSFGFWRDLPPEHCGEDVLAQLLVARRFGGCGLLPSGVFHLELPTTLSDRRVDAPFFLRSMLEEAAPLNEPSQPA